MDLSTNNISFISNKFKELEYFVFLKVLQSERKKESFIKLKNHYKDKINSTRVFDRICDFEDLFRVLKKRDVLSYKKLETFMLTSIIIGDKELVEKISEFEQNFKSFDINKTEELDENGKFSTPDMSREREQNNCLENETKSELLRIEENAYLKKQDRLVLLSNVANDKVLKEPEKNSSLDHSEKDNSFVKIELLTSCNEIAAANPTEESEISKERPKLQVINTWTLNLIIISLIVFMIISIIISQSYNMINSLRLTPTGYVENLNCSSKRNISNPPGMSSDRFNFRRNNSSKETEIQKLVFNQISDRIGNKWRDLARYLDVKESDIDEIDVKYHSDLKEKAYQILRISLIYHNPQKWKIALMQALAKTRRRDLHDWVQANYQS